MRVAVNASIYDGRPSGLGAYTRSLLHALDALGADLVTFTSRPDDLPGGRGILPLGEPSRGPAGHAWRLLWSQVALPLWAGRSRARVLLNTVPEGPLRASMPQVTVVHDVLPLVVGARRQQRWYLRRFVPAVLRASAVVVADSAQTRQDVLDHYDLDPARVVVVCPGLDHTRFHPGAAGADPPFGLARYVLYVGNLLPHKNLHRLLSGFARVPGDVTLAIAGYRDHRYWPDLDRRARTLRIESRVRFLGYVADDLLPALYTHAIAVIAPSLYEGFGLTVVEAMACGVPVVASTTGGLREAAGDAALLVDPRDEAALAGAVQRLLDDPGLRRDLRARGVAHAGRFTWEATAREIHEVLTRAQAGPI